MGDMADVRQQQPGNSRNSPPLHSEQKIAFVDGSGNEVAFLFVFDKNCPIIDYLGSKDSSHKL